MTRGEAIPPKLFHQSCLQLKPGKVYQCRPGYYRHKVANYYLSSPYLWIVLHELPRVNEMLMKGKLELSSPAIKNCSQSVILIMLVSTNYQNALLDWTIPKAQRLARKEYWSRTVDHRFLKEETYADEACLPHLPNLDVVLELAPNFKTRNPISGAYKSKWNKAIVYERPNRPKTTSKTKNVGAFSARHK